MAKILLINPIIRQDDRPKHIPYGLAYLAAIARNHGHEVQFYDQNAWRKNDEVIRQVVAADDWDVVGIGGLITTYNSIKHIVKIVKEVAPKTFLIGGGGFFTCMPKEMMTWLPELDLGVVGEAFVTWPEILEMIDRKDFDFSKTLGVCYRDKNREPKLTAVRPNIRDIDTLPYPAFDLMPLDIYFSNSQLLQTEQHYTSKRRIDVNGSFGCNFICRYCWHLGTTGDLLVEKDEHGESDVRFSYGRNIRYHSPRYIVDMVKSLVRDHQIDFVSFLDENMMTMHVASGRKWLFELSDLWIKEGLQPTCCRDGVEHDENCKGVHWSGTSHAGLAEPNVLNAMAKAGAAGLVYGLESFDPTILKNLGKGSNQAANARSVGMALDAGIIPVANIIIGFPEETFQSIRTTIEWMIKLGIHSKPHFATAYPGTEWYYAYKDSILKQYNGDLEAFVSDLGDASKITATISHKFSPVQLLGLQQIVLDRNLRLLDLTEKHWGDADKLINPIAAPKESIYMVKKKVSTPLEETSQSLAARLST